MKTNNNNMPKNKKKKIKISNLQDKT